MSERFDQPSECYEPDDDMLAYLESEPEEERDGNEYDAEVRYEEERAYRANRAHQSFNLRRVLNGRATASRLPHRRGARRAPRRHVRSIRRRTAAARSSGRQDDDPDLADRRLRWGVTI
jgi:hypothetical protein